MMKIGKILFGVSALFLVNGMMAQSKLDAKQGLDVNKQLQYCHKQVGRALEERSRRMAPTIIRWSSQYPQGG